MGDIVNLRAFPIPLDTPLGQKFVVDVARASEGLLTDDEIQTKYELTPEAWRNSTKDKALVHAVRAERDRRVLNGTAAREAAARHFVKAPAILDGIMTDAYSSPRHKIEAIKELRQTAVGESTEGLPESDRFIITINLGEGHVEHFDKPRAPMKPVNRDEHDGEE
jgi:hypothetical protein